MATRLPEALVITVLFEVREDGGLRATCEGVPGFLLSHRNHDLVIDDVVPALTIMLSEMYGYEMAVVPAEKAGMPGHVPDAHICAERLYVGEPLIEGRALA